MSPTRETHRLNVLRDYGILDSEAEDAFDDAARFAAEICETPIAMVTFVDSERVWVKARVGIEVCAVPRGGAPCSAVVEQRETMLVIPDTLADPRYAQSPMVQNAPHVRFYAGAALLNEEGVSLGAICVADRRPRDLKPEQLSRLARLARQVVRDLESRRRVLQLKESREHSCLLEACVAHSNDMIIISRAEPGQVFPRIVFVNDAFLRRMGYASAAMVGQSLESLYSSSPESPELARLRAAVQSWKPVRVEMIQRAKNGEGVWVEQDLSPVANGGMEFTHWVSVHRDISARKASETSLNRANRLLDETQKLAGVGGWELNLADRKVFWTEETYRIFDVSPETYEPAVASGLRFYSEDSRRRLKTAMEAAMRDGTSFDMEVDAHTSGERHIWIFVTCKAISEHGRPVKIIGAVQDITAQKEAAIHLAGLSLDRNRKEEALFASRQMLQRVLDTIPQRVFWKDGQSVYLGCNQSFAEDMGFANPEEVVGKTDFHALWAANAELYRADDRSVMQSNQARLKFEEPQERTDGRALWLRTNKIPLHDREGRVTGVLGTYEDITDLKEQQKSLRLLGSAVENARESIMITDGDLDQPGPRILYVNPAFSRLSGYAKEEVFGKTPRLLQGPRSDRDVLARLRRNLEAGEMFEGETTNYRKDGSEYSVAWQIAPIRDEHGAVTHFVGVQRDVTEQKAAHAELLRAKEGAEAANRAKSEFLSRMSHELRTPLHAILGFSQLLQRRKPTEEQSESLQFIAKAGRHLLDLINEILDLSRIECGGTRISLEPVALLDVLAESQSLVQNLSVEKEVRIECETGGLAGRHVLADRQKLKQIFVNLLSNAIKYNRDQGAVHVSCGPADEGAWKIQVRDTGLGIKPEKMKNLFTPFERLGADQTGVEGTGIGLALSRRLANLMGGALEAESEYGTGSVFSVVLPRAERAADTAAPENPKPTVFPWALQGNATKVLYVEDNPVNTVFMTHVFRERVGVELITTASGEETLPLARQHQPGLILLDLHLPDINGDEILKRLQADPQTSATPVVILSADAMNRQIDYLMELGARDYLTKPLEVEKVLQVIQRFLAPCNP